MERRSTKTHRLHITGINVEFRRAGAGRNNPLACSPADRHLALPVINVQAGTLKGADSSFGFFSTVRQITVAAGATLDLAGNGTLITNLSGGGAVIDSGAAATLTLNAANFSGAISGPQSLDAKGAVLLTGANTYTGTTTIDSGDGFEIGSAARPVRSAAARSVDGGTLSIDAQQRDHARQCHFRRRLLEQIGTGVTSINAANTYTGGTALSAGTLAIGNAGALGTGASAFSNGELLGTATETFCEPIIFPPPAARRR